VTRIVALAGDLMDRSRLTSAIPEIELLATPAEVAGADVVVVDLARHAGALAAVRHHAPDARIVGYGPHVDTDTLAAATAAGADRVLARSRFFRDPRAALEWPADRSAGADGPGPGA